MVLYLLYLWVNKSIQNPYPWHLYYVDTALTNFFSAILYSISRCLKLTLFHILSNNFWIVSAILDENFFFKFSPCYFLHFWWCHHFLCTGLWDFSTWLLDPGTHFSNFKFIWYESTISCSLYLITTRVKLNDKFLLADLPNYHNYQ